MILNQYLHLSCIDEPGGRAGPGGTTTLCIATTMTCQQQ